MRTGEPDPEPETSTISTLAVDALDALDAVPEAFLLARPILDEEGRLADAELVFMNRFARDRWFDGSPSRDIAGVRLFQRFPWARANVFDLYAQVVASGGSATDLRRMTTPHGTRWIDVTVTRLEGGILHASRDVTAAMEAQAKVAASETTLRRTMDRSPIGLCLVAPDGRFMSVNGALCEFLGRDAATLMTSTWQELTHPDDVGIDQGLVDEVLAGGRESYRLRKRYLRPDGAVAWGDLSVSCLRDEDGAVRHFISQIVDISAEQAAMETLRASEERYRALAESAADAIVTADDRGRIVAWNPAAVRMFGHTADEAIGQSLDLIVPASLRPRHTTAMDRLRSTGERRIMGTTTTITGRRADGSEFPIELSLSEWQTTGGHFSTAIIRDISDRVREHRLLVSEQQQLAEAQRLASVGSWTWDPVSDRPTWSDEYFRIFGLAPDSPVPPYTAQESLFTPESWLSLGEAVAQALGAATPYEIELEIVRVDGVHRTAVARGEAVRDEAGAVVMLRGTLADITERRAEQRRLSEAELLLAEVQRDELVAALAGGVAHEYNNQLAAIMGHAEILSSELGPGHPLREDARAIVAASRRAALMTRQLLAFGRGQILRPSTFDVDNLVLSLLPMLRAAIGADVELVVERSGEPPIARADRGLLTEALSTLAMASRDAMPNGGRLTIATTLETVLPGDARLDASASAGDYVRLCVSDTGPAIAADALDRLFEPSFAATRLGRGTWLGLAGVEGGIRQSGGFMEASTTPSGETVISLFIPRAVNRHRA